MYYELLVMDGKYEMLVIDILACPGDLISAL